MFAPERMQELNLFVLAADLEPMTEALARLGSLHLQEVQPESWSLSAAWAEVALKSQHQAQQLASFLAALDINVPVTIPKEALRPAQDVKELEAEVKLLGARLADWKQRAEANERRLQQLYMAQTQVEVLLPLQTPVDNLRDLHHLHLTIGTLPNANLKRIAEALFQIPYVLVPIQSDRHRTLVFAASAREEAAVLDRALKSAFFEVIALPLEARGEPQDALELLRQQLEQTRLEQARLSAERQDLAQSLGPHLRNLWQRAQADAQLADAMRRFARHGQVYLIAGWVPEAALAELEQTVRAVAKEQVVIEHLPASKLRRDVPTLLRSPAWLRPFEGLVSIFGLPSYNEVNPTAFAALAFLLMYGMMFGDLGHGVLLALGGVWLLRSNRTLGQLIIAAGISGVVFGLLYGMGFGLSLFEPLWLQPMHAIESLLLSAIIGGVALLNLGFCLNLVNAWRRGDWPSFLLDKNGLLGILLYWTLLGGGYLVLNQDLALRLWLLLLMVLALLLWLRGLLIQHLWGGKREALAEALVTGFFELFEALIGYASNSLSFVRLGAFAVAHEGLSSVILRYSGGPGGWLVLLLGTLLIVGFEGLIVGIQTLRLEYYEFFGRFFSGTGQAFRPLSLKGGQDESLGVRL